MSDEAKRERIEAIYRKSRRSFPRIADLTAEELQGKPAEEQVVVVDVRSPEEQAVSMIDGAITSGEFEARLGAYEGATVVAYCTMGHPERPVRAGAPEPRLDRTQPDRGDPRLDARRRSIGRRRWPDTHGSRLGPAVQSSGRGVQGRVVTR
jgi:hypothetical protein